MRSVAWSLIVAALMVQAALIWTIPTEAHAETVSYEAPMPKGIGGGIRCSGVAEQDGHRYEYTNWVGYSFGADEASERAWQLAECERILGVDMGNWFMTRHGVNLNRDAIRMTVTRL